jgi:hypothetical protein
MRVEDRYAGDIEDTFRTTSRIAVQ